MPGTVVQGPSLRMLMRSAQAGRGMEAGRARNVSGGGGQNPMRGASSAGSRQAAPEFDAQGHELEQPIEGLTSLVFHPLNESIRERRNAQIDAAEEEHQGKLQSAMQDAVDFYHAHDQGGGSQATMHAVLQDPDFAKHFSNPDAFQALHGMYQLMGSTEAGGVPQITSVGGHEFANVNGKWQVLKPTGGAGKNVQTYKDATGQQFERDPTTGTWNKSVFGSGQKLQYGPDGNVIRNAAPGDQTPGAPQTLSDQPTLKGDLANKPGHLLASDLTDIKGIQQVTNALTKIGPVSGAATFGIGALGPAFAQSPFGTDKLKEYETQRENLLASANSLSASGNSRLKMVAQDIRNLIPAAGASQDTVQNYDIPNMRDRARQGIAAMIDTIQARNAPVPPELANLAKNWGADPGYYGQVQAARAKMQTPGSLTNQEVQLLDADHHQFQSTTNQEALVLDRQRAMRNMMDPVEYAQQKKNNSGFGAALSPTEDPHAYGTFIDYNAMRAMPQPPAQPPVHQEQQPSASAPIPPASGMSTGLPNQGTPTQPPGPQSNAGGLIPGAQAAEMPGTAPAAQAQPQKGMSAQEMQPPGETASATAPLPPPGGAPIDAQQQSDLAMAQQAMQGPNADELARQSAAQHLIEQAQQLSTPPPQGQ